MNTKDRIVETIVAKGFSTAEALRIYRVYTRAGIAAIKIDAHNGSWSYTHFGFAEVEVMRRVLKEHE